METGSDYTSLDYWTTELRALQQSEEMCRRRLVEACQSLKEVGVSDRAIAERTGFSRARIQQLRTADG